MALLLIFGLICLLGFLNTNLLILGPALLGGNIPWLRDTLSLVVGITFLCILSKVLGLVALVAFFLINCVTLLCVDSFILDLTILLGISSDQGKSIDEQGTNNEELKEKSLGINMFLNILI